MGDEVSWTLSFRPDEGESLWPDAMVIEIDPADCRGVPDDRETIGCVTLADGVEAAIAAAPLVSHERVHGTLVEEHHGGVPEGLPPTHGTVRRIRVIRQEFRLAGDRAWRPVPGSVQLHDVDRVPDTFGSESPTGDRRTLEVGVLVDLDASTRRDTSERDECGGEAELRVPRGLASCLNSVSRRLIASEHKQPNEGEL